MAGQFSSVYFCREHDLTCRKSNGTSCSAGMVQSCAVACWCRPTASIIVGPTHYHCCRINLEIPGSRIAAEVVVVVVVGRRGIKKKSEHGVH